MTTITNKNKKGTVIHRTTSETLRLGDETINNQIRIPSMARKKSQVTSPSCSFQITGIMTRYDQEDESADDLDESHTDDISRVTDNETPSFSEDSRDEQNPSVQPYIFSQNNNTLAKHSSPNEGSILPPPPIVAKEEPQMPKANINNLGRFRVVKLGSMVPFSRGRWTCYDYVDESSEMKRTFASVDSSTITKPYWETSCQSNYLYTGSILLPEPIPIYVPLSCEKTTPISSQYTLPKTRVNFVSCNSVETIINNSRLDNNQNNQTRSEIFNSTSPVPPNQEVLLITNVNQASVLNSNDNNGTSMSCTATIDTKIEHALDVVKNHLTHAVRLEVEELKIKINELVERISYLEYENDLLRANVTPDVLANLGTRRN